jgi:hypothetical protein
MASSARFAEVASLAGDPTRAGMLQALMDGRALTASELARVAGVTPGIRRPHRLPILPPENTLLIAQQVRFCRRCFCRSNSCRAPTPIPPKSIAPMHEWLLRGNLGNDSKRQSAARSGSSTQVYRGKLSYVGSPAFCNPSI